MSTGTSGTERSMRENVMEDIKDLLLVFALGAVFIGLSAALISGDITRARTPESTAKVTKVWTENPEGQPTIYKFSTTNGTFQIGEDTFGQLKENDSVCVKYDTFIHRGPCQTPRKVAPKETSAP